MPSFMTRETTEAQLRFFIRLLDECFWGIAIADAESHRLLWCNQTVQKWFGYAWNPADGAREIHDLVPPDQRATHKDDFASYVRAPETRLMGEGREGRNLQGWNDREQVSFPVEVGLQAIETDSPVGFPGGEYTRFVVATIRKL